MNKKIADNNKNLIYDYIKTNREKSMTANYSKFWCDTRDAQLRGKLGKCPNCGAYADKKKKESMN